MRNILSFFIFLSFISSTIAQTGTIRGKVVDKNSGEPILFCNVILEGTSYGATTDLDGFYFVPKVPVGDYKITVSYIGYNTFSEDIEITDKKIINKNIFLEEGGITLEQVKVSASKEQARSDVKISKISVSPKQIQAIPSTGGEPDLVQYLSIVPGIVSTGDQGGQLYIRGGSPIQNKVLLDGLTIYNPFHSIGFFSVFETEIVKNVDVLTGGFNAEYGGRISAVVDITTRQGNPKRFKGTVSINPFLGKVVLEGPLKKWNPESTISSSFIVTAKKSWIESTSPVIYNHAVGEIGKLPYDFTDIYSKFSLRSQNGSKFDVFGFNFSDRVNYSVADLNWQTTGGGTSFSIIPPSSNLNIGGIIGFSKYDIGLVEEEGKPRNSKINGFNAGLNFKNYINQSTEAYYGFIINAFNTEFKFENLHGNTFEQEDFTTEIGAFVKVKRTIGKLIIEPGIRYNYFASLGEGKMEPRLGLKFAITDNFRFKAAGGVYNQNLISTVNERDVVNLFIGFLSGPEENIKPRIAGEKVNSRLQTAYHAISGVEIDVNNAVTVEVEAYYKKFDQLININRNKRSGLDADYVAESGEAKGVDFLVKFQKNSIFIQSSYSLGFVNRDDGEQIYPTLFDRRHNINFLSTYAFGNNKSWEAALRWNFGTGFPFTQQQGFFEELNFDNGIETDIINQNGDLGIIYSEVRNGGRLPTYHRMDLSLKKKIKFSKSMNLEITAGLTNAYNRGNIFYFDRVSYERVNQLPYLPSLSMKFQF